jgi:hypothetical protein
MRRQKVGPTIDQINADIPAYTKMFEIVIFVVYDVFNAISDDKKFISALKRDKKEVEVLVL